MNTIKQLVQEALEKRSELFCKLEQEQTDCYRLFHGTAEGMPGVTMDRYGDQLLLQSFHSTLTSGDQQALIDGATEHFSAEDVIYNDRSAANSRRADEKLNSSRESDCHELGVRYLVRGKHSGQDPLLFLDMRAGRRFIKGNANGKSVLNLFSYTCGVGICASKYGASKVCNVDFAERNLAVGERNLELNQLDPDTVEFFKSDYFTAIKQMSGIEIRQRVRRGQKPKRYPKAEQQQFDLVYLDPPRWAKSAFGTVDLIRDYQSLLKPAALTVADGGQLICTNNVGKVTFDEWQEQVLRCCDKAGRPVKSFERLVPDSDFPTLDGQHPLKMLILSF